MTHFRTIDISNMQPAELASQPSPQMLWVEIAQLVIDDQNQRPLSKNNLSAIKRIASDFRWSRFSPVIDAPIEGGRYAIIDGQHRAHAAALCGIKSIPAMVALVAPEEQAQAFIDINTRQIRVSGHQVYRAALTADEEWAVECGKAVSAAGCELMTSNRSTADKRPGEVSFVALIRKTIEAGHGAAVTAGLTAVREFDPESVANFSDALLTPFLGAAAETGATASELVAALHARKPWLVIVTADRLAKTEGKPMAVVRRGFFVALIHQVQREGAA